MEIHAALRRPDLQAVWKTGRAVIATFTQLKTPHAHAHHPPSLNFLDSISKPNQKVNISPPSIILHPSEIPPTTQFHWLMLLGSLCCDTPKKTVLLNVVDEHG